MARHARPPRSAKRAERKRRVPPGNTLYAGAASGVAALLLGASMTSSQPIADVLPTIRAELPASGSSEPERAGTQAVDVPSHERTPGPHDRFGVQTPAPLAPTSAPVGTGSSGYSGGGDLGSAGGSSSGGGGAGQAPSPELAPPAVPEPVVPTPVVPAPTAPEPSIPPGEVPLPDTDCVLPGEESGGEDDGGLLGLNLDLSPCG